MGHSSSSPWSAQAPVMPGVDGTLLVSAEREDWRSAISLSFAAITLLMVDPIMGLGLGLESGWRLMPKLVMGSADRGFRGVERGCLGVDEGVGSGVDISGRGVGAGVGVDSDTDSDNDCDDVSSWGVEVKDGLNIGVGWVVLG